MKLTAKEIGFLETWKKKLEYDTKRRSTVSKWNIKRKSVNNERITMINKVIDGCRDTES